MALIHFNIWESGRVDRKKLKQLLRSAISQSLWDAVLEFKILPSPLCHKLQEEEEEKEGDECNDSRQDIEDETVRRLSENEEEVKVEHKKLTLKRLSQEAVLAYGSVLGVSPLPQIVVEGGRPEAAAEALTLPRSRPLDDYEAGRRGRLATAFQRTVWDWTRLGQELGAPAYQEHSVLLFAKPSLADLREELLALIHAVLPDLDLRMFQKRGSTAYLPRTESGLYGGDWPDQEDCVVVGRSLRMWKACVGPDNWTELSHFRSKFSKQFQTFPSLLISQAKSAAESEAVAIGTNTGTGTVNNLFLFFFFLQNSHAKH
jgi:hypothetical protein